MATVLRVSLGIDEGKAPDIGANCANSQVYAPITYA